LSIKEDLKAVKEELNTEEQFLESLIRAERFFKKYKKQFIALAAVLIVLFVGYSIKTYIDESNLKAANIAYLKLLKNPDDKASISTLKEKNINLYYAYELQTATKKGDIKTLQNIAKEAKGSYIADLAFYQSSSLKGDKKSIESYLSSSNPGLLKNFALLLDAYKLLSQGKEDEAKIKLSSIEVDSPLKNIANNLENYIK